MRGSKRSPKGEDVSSVRAWIWILGACVVMAAGIQRSRLPSFASALRLPATPIDRTAHRGAALWLFLVRVRDSVPAGASFTIQAEDTDDEMSLYMLSLGLLAERVVLPSSYYGIPTPDVGARARFIVVYGTPGERIGRARLVRAISGGAVYERPAG